MPRSRVAFLSAVATAAALTAAPLRAQSSGGGAAARAFVDSAESQLAALTVKANRAQWVAATFITDDTEQLSADATERVDVATQQLALAARRFDGVALPADVRRKLTLLKLLLVAPPPSDPAKATELTRLGVGLEAEYGRGAYCRRGALGQPATAAGDSTCYEINALSRALAESHDPAVLLDAWQGWHAVARPMRPRYERFVALSNEGARELGFRDAGAMWRASYDMPPEQFSAELERLWQQVRPLYVSLHAYVRTRLNQQYGEAVVPKDGMIPAHLLGNMWAQEWGNVYPLVAPPAGAPSADVTALLKARGYDQRRMMRTAEGFFTSLGFAPLPATFWERSMIVKPRDREVVCHASAWDVDSKNDVRIKMCAEATGEDFVTMHHELGHNFYQRAYSGQPFLFENGANDGFHEAIGDAVALSITPDYLTRIGLLAPGAAPSAAADTGALLRQALDKVAFLPFGLLIDQWRWKVFSGEVTPANYNRAWWDLRARYQGVAPPVARTEADFDPGAKFHVPANTPYTRYFLARVLQFQFYRAMCRAAGQTGPLYRCSFYGSKEAGARLARMLEAGESRPWQETLYAMTGERDMDAGAMLEYFAPLKVWLDRQNAGHPVGWAAPGGAPVGTR
ncbi:angiotensin-converting enzyme [Gemmatimonadetes bacterium T265]|nr:angiotensin-converting enzyme [Gemmatimonadetes bacterium T265]